MTPTEKHREMAKDIAFDFDCDWTADGRRRGEAEYRAAIEAIAAALAEAEREGMEAERARCADIVERFAPGGDLYSEDFIDNDVATRVAIRGEILSEAGKDD